MPDISFDASGHARFATRFHGEVTLSKAKWDEVCSEPERTHYRFNGDKVGTTLVNPDLVRYSNGYPNQFHYYKKFESMKLNENISIPGGRFPYFCVIVDAKSRRVCTTYPVDKPKPGKEYKDEKGT